MQVNCVICVFWHAHVENNALQFGTHDVKLLALTDQSPSWWLLAALRWHECQQTDWEDVWSLGRLSQRHTLNTGHARIKCSLNICVMAESQTQAAVAGPACVCWCVIQPRPQFRTPDSSWLLPSSVSPTFTVCKNEAVMVDDNEDKLHIGSELLPSLPFPPD